MRFLTVLLLLAITSFSSFSQTRYKVGKVSKKDWQIEKLDSLREVCDAVIIENIGLSRIDYNTTKGWMLEYNYYIKVLVLNDKGIDQYGNLDIVFSDNDDVYVKGYTYSLAESGKVEDEKFTTRDGMFTEYTDFRDNLILHIPNVKKNTIVEYELKILSQNIANVRDWVFQSENPVLFSEYTTITPEYFDFNAFYQGSYPVKIEKGEGVSSINGTDFSETYSYFKKVYSAKNLPGVPDEIYTSVKSNSFTKYRFEIRGYRDFYLVYHPLGSNYSTIIKERLFDNSYFVQYQKNNNILNDIIGDVKIDNSISGANTVYRLVSKNIAWNKQNGWVTPNKSYRKLINDRNGSAAEINNLLVGALRKAGFNAYPVLLNTRNAGRVNPFVPLISNFNYVICLLEVDGQRVLLDATEPQAPFGLIPLRCINGKALIVRDDATEQWVNLSTYLSAETLSSVEFSIDPEEEKIEKSINRKRLGIDLVRFITGLDSAKYVEDFNQRYTSEFSDAEINAHEINLEGSGAIENLNISQTVLSANNTIYISPFEDFKFKKNPFKNEKRYQGIDFVSPWKKVFMVTVNVPEGYTVQSDIKNKVFVTSDQKMSFKITSSKVGNKVIYTSMILIKDYYFLHTKYDEIKMFFDAVEKELSKQVMLVSEV
ncbi:hypothetical protein [Mangrovivirga cuniculi]|uniref:DUF3857 domain-containing protein n=1 Tax=Mangrovivirga cuniculi TaxID=2715131 RepID=A0A4D7JHE9_9BACT|nr:hypothetical protein [Mangrovivirga cuniculi]QCK15499.1 hypothetical protein DCC35_12470 [Mangrovivirga cuniculi]